MADGSLLHEDGSRDASRAPDRPRKRQRLSGVMIGNFPPRVCGIATFTRDLLQGLASASPETRWKVVAMDDHAHDGDDPYDFPAQVTHVLPQDHPDGYIKLADDLNRSGADFVLVQHEFGIFGGSAGSHLLLLLRRLRMPVIVTLHTVLEKPDPEQRRVMDEILINASAIIVMAHKGAAILQQTYEADPDRIHVIPHGAPSRPLLPTAGFKERFGLSGRKTISTFGLLSPNKGIETIIEALPDIVRRHPEIVYVVAGATHPHLVAREGECYREGLIARAGELGVRDNLQFINRYLSDDDVVDILQATDVYVTPYLTETQITSGTLSYAIALGRPIVSTPYWHAAEALADGAGVLCPFGDSARFAEEINRLFTDDRLRARLSARALKAGIPSRWLNVGQTYMSIARAVSAEHIAAA
jgi:glycosyltransferase involved in cell wall biosynthesis